MFKKYRLAMQWLFYILVLGVGNRLEIGARAAMRKVLKVLLRMLFAPSVTGIGCIVAYVVWRGKWLSMTMSLRDACLTVHGWELCGVICVESKT